MKLIILNHILPDFFKQNLKLILLHYTYNYEGNNLILKLFKRTLIVIVMKNLFFTI